MSGLEFKVASTIADTNSDRMSGLVFKINASEISNTDLAGVRIVLQICFVQATKTQL